MGRRTSSGGSNSETDRVSLLLQPWRPRASLATTFSCSGSITTACFSLRGLSGNCIHVALSRRGDGDSRLRTCAFSQVGQQTSLRPDCFPTLLVCNPRLKTGGPSGDGSRRVSARSFPGVTALFLGVGGGNCATTFAGRASFGALPRKKGCVLLAGPAGFDVAFFWAAGRAASFFFAFRISSIFWPKADRLAASVPYRMTVTVGSIFGFARGRPLLFFGDATVSKAGFGGLETSLPLLVTLICFFGVVFCDSSATGPVGRVAASKSGRGCVLGATACSCIASTTISPA